MNNLQKLKGSARSLFYSLLCVLLLAYGGIATGLYFAQDKLVFPGVDANKSNALMLLQKYPDSRITYRIDNATLHGWHLNADVGKPMVLYYGGNADDVSNAALQSAPLQNIQTVFVNYRGYADSTGTPTEAHLYHDALQVFDDRIKRYAPKKIIVVGRSLGTGVATYVASQRHVDGLILVTPYDSLTGVAHHRYPYIPVSWLLKYPFDSLSHADKLTMPTLVLIADNDSVVPHENTERLLQKLPATTETKTLADTTHGNIVDSPEYLPTIEKFLDEINSR